MYSGEPGQNGGQIRIQHGRNAISTNFCGLNSSERSKTPPGLKNISIVFFFSNHRFQGFFLHSSTAEQVKKKYKDILILALKKKKNIKKSQLALIFDRLHDFNIN